MLGEPGSWKTTLALQFPNPGVDNLDDNLDGPDDFLRNEKKQKLEYRFLTPLIKEDGTPYEEAEFAETADRLLTSVKEIVADPWVKTIIIDSATKLSDALIRWVLRKNLKPMMDRNLWQPFRTEMMRLTDRARNSGKHFILTAHETKIYDIKGQVVGATMSIPSKLSDIFGFQFTDIWRCVVKKNEQGKLVGVVRFLPDGEAPLKNSMRLPAFLPNDWSIIEPRIRHRLNFAEVPPPVTKAP